MPSTLASVLTSLVFAILVLRPVPGAAQVNDEQNVFDWYYAAVFGTGVYRVGARDVTIFEVPYSRVLWRSADAQRRLRLSVPAVVGIYDFDVGGIPDLDFPDLDIQDVATLTVYPGLYYIVPLNAHWTVKPFVHLGYGKEFSGGEEALIYSAGVGAMGIYRYDRWKFVIGHALYYASNTRESQTDLGFAGAEIALDVSYPTPWQFNEQNLRGGVYVVYYKYSNLEFIQPSEDKIQLSDQYEIGLTLQTEAPNSIFGLEVDRIGIGYLAGKDFDAIRFVLEFEY